MNENNVIIDNLQFANEVHYVNPIVLTASPNIYKLGIEVKSGEKGDSGFTSKNAIEEAASQAFRGVNGLILEFAKRGEKVLSRRKLAWFIPVIFTTAKIWTSEIDLGTADLESGKIGLDDIKAEEKKWIWLEYHVSPGIKHHLFSSGEINKELRDILVMNYTRTIAIVNYDGIEDFLKRDFSS
jgi:hypothetical protein